MSLLVVRHGATAWSENGRHTGRTDLPLLPEGEAQAEALRPALAGCRFAQVLTSPLSRAEETCRLAGFGDIAQRDVDLVEWDYGEYEGLTTEEIRSRRPGWTLWSDGAAGGETAAEVARRADRVIQRVRGVDGETLCFAHGHLLRVLASRWVGLPPEGGRLLVLEPATVSRLGWERETPVLARWNVPVSVGER